MSLSLSLSPELESESESESESDLKVWIFMNLIFISSWKETPTEDELRCAA